MLIYGNLCKLSCVVVFKTKRNDFLFVENLVIDTRNTSVGDLLEKLEHFKIDGFKYAGANLC